MIVSKSRYVKRISGIAKLFLYRVLTNDIWLFIFHPLPIGNVFLPTLHNIY